MKPCDDYTLALSAFVDGELSDTERAALLNHLTECEGCRAYLAELSAMHDAFAEMEEERAPEGFAESVMVLPGLTGQKKDAEAPTAQEQMVMSAPTEGAEDAAAETAPAPEKTDGAGSNEGKAPAAWEKTNEPGASAADNAAPEAEAEEPMSVLVVYGEGAEEYLAAHAEGYTYDADGDPAEYILPPEELDELEEKLDELGLSYEEACLPDQTFHVQIVPGGEAG